MKMLVEFDVDGDLVDVPAFVVSQREGMRSQFLKWLYDKGAKRRYWVRIPDGRGGWHEGVMFRGEALVEWLNKKVLKDHNEKAFLLEQHVCIDAYKEIMPSIFF